MRQKSVSLDELEASAVKWWPEALTKQVASESPGLLLMQSQERFVDELVGLPRRVTDLRVSLKEVEMPFNLFLKHLMVLADFGGEKIKRLFRDRDNLFQSGATHRNAYYDAELDNEIGRVEVSAFAAAGSMSNASLGLQGSQLAEVLEPTPLMTDVVMMTLTGGLATDTQVSENLSGCDLLKFAQDRDSLHKFMRLRYLAVSRIVQGANSNSLGQAVQSHVGDKLSKLLGSKFSLRTPATIVVNGRPITSDILFEGPSGRVAVEVAFQVTTNSVIERKGNEASQRRRELNSVGVASCYVLDGIGNFERQSALKKIMSESDYTVNMSDIHLTYLADFVREWCT